MRVKALIMLSLFVLVCTAKAQNISVNAEINYKMLSLNEMRDVFYLRFKNINENQIQVLDFTLPIPKSENAKIVEVKDLPEGYVKVSEVSDEEGREYYLIQVRKTLTPFEEYHIRITREISKPLDNLGEGVYSFRVFEFPSYFRKEGFHVEAFKISLKFPDSIFKNYNILSTSSNTKFTYKSLNRIDSLEWEYINPPDQVNVYVSFTEVPNFFLLNILGAAATLVAFALLLFYTFRIERRLKSHAIINNPPWSGNLLAKMKEMIQHAEKEILITSPHIYYTDWLTAELQPLISKNVKFRIITWPSYKREVFRSIEDVEEDRKQFFTLKRFLEMFPRGSVKLNDNIHAKMLIVDEREILVTTANLSQTGLYENYEIGIYAENPELAKAGKRFFESVWNSEDTIDLDEESVKAKTSWAIIMDIKSRKEGEQ